MIPRAFSEEIVLVVDDDPSLLQTLETTLTTGGYRAIATTDADRAAAVLDAVPVDAVIADLDLPMRNGRVFAANTAARHATTPVIVITGHHDLARVHGMLAGAIPRAIVPKPFAVESLLQTIAQVLRDAGPPGAHRRSRRVTRDLARSLARALSLRDVETEAHARRVALWTRLLAKELGWDDDAVFWAETGALLHDVGKIGVPDAILHKPDALDAAEWEIMRSHPRLGAELLEPIAELRPATDVVLRHHESWDGRGYPEGLAGEEIPAAARAFAVVDTYDAITASRPYRGAVSDAEARKRILEARGTQLEPDSVDAFLGIPEARWIEVPALVARGETDAS